MPYAHEYPPADWTEAGIADALATSSAHSLPTREDRQPWTAVMDDPRVGPRAADIVADAESAGEEPMPTLPASLALAYEGGDDEARTEFLNAHRTHQTRLTTFTLAECLEAGGRFLDDVLDYAWAVCERTSWVNPSNLWRGREAEQYRGGLPRVDPDPELVTIELLSARAGFQLAEVAYLLGESLHPGIRDRIRREVERRLIRPYERRDDYWWLDPPTNNWNAVCNSCAVGSALYLLEDPERTASTVRKGVRSLRHYLETFDPDGGCVEGVGYWNAFGNYVILSDLLESRTGGEYSLLSPPIVEEIAQFPLRVQLDPDRYPTFGDSRRAWRLDPYLPCYVGERFDVPDLVALGRRGLTEESGNWVVGPLAQTARNLLWTAGLPDDSGVEPPRQAYFRGIEWWIARTRTADGGCLAVAAKGGDNGHTHNHNDCGSFVYHYRGESLLDDLGAPVYSSDYFDGETRYTHLAARSLGHSVPYVNGTEQRSASPSADDERREDRDESGSVPGATVIDHAENERHASFVVELADAYPDASGLSSLRREFTLDRTGSGRLEVADTATFDDAPGTLESVLVSHFPMRIDDGRLRIEGERGSAIVDAGDSEVRVEQLEGAMSMKTDAWMVDAEEVDVWRARVGPVEGTSTNVSLSVVPESIEGSA